MSKALFRVLLGIAATLVSVCAAENRAVPDFGIILNDDGDHSFTALDPRKSEAALRTKVRSLQGTAVRTLVYQVVAGSEIALYPTKIGSAWGWREAPDENKSPWKEQMPFLRAAVTNGLDAGRTAGEETRAMGLRFMPGYRMNDAHFAANPLAHPATGRFWIENHERFKIGKAPSERTTFLANLLDYSHAEVRAHRLALIEEIIGRYADLMDGVQLDFSRQPFIFPPGEGEAKKDLMTEFIARVRARLDEAGRQQGRFLCLSVRVPPTLRGCRWAGLDIEAWLAKHLVEVVVLSPSMTLAHDMPVDEFVALAKPVGARIYPAIFRRTPFTWPFASEPTANSYSRSPSRTVTAPQVRGAGANYLSMGATGFELYNFNLPPVNYTLEAIAALAKPRDGERIYAITQAYAHDRDGLAEDRKQIPVSLSTGAPVELILFIGENLAAGNSRATLRLGLHGPQPAASAEIRIEINGHPLHDGPLTQIATPVSGRESRPSSLNPPRVDTYLHLPVTDASAFRAGRNQLLVQLRAAGQRPKTQLVEVQLDVQDRK